jgi:hypothetical protein
MGLLSWSGRGCICSGRGGRCVIVIFIVFCSYISFLVRVYFLLLFPVFSWGLRRTGYLHAWRTARSYVTLGLSRGQLPPRSMVARRDIINDWLGARTYVLTKWKEEKDCEGSRIAGFHVSIHCSRGLIYVVTLRHNLS